ncbi:hypothetical protein [Bremerella alba]|uniref:hypothetical protein n=1 Tax=Bremerella alba TaxID=980252 RepID=UPI001A955AAF|nr:hypothetical protein [Bremerella alba]
MSRSNRLQISLKGLLLAILTLSAGLAILRATKYDLHQFVGVTATIAGVGAILFLAALYSLDLIGITTWAMRVRRKRNDSNSRQDPPQPD